MDTLNRRTYLGLAGTVLAGGLAGCAASSADAPTGTRADGSPDGSAESPGDGNDSARTRTLGDPYAPDDGAAITLERPRYERIVVGYYEPHYEIRSHPDWQFLVVDVGTDRELPEDFAAGWFGDVTVHPVVEGERVDPPFPAQYVPPDGFNAVVPGLAVPFPVRSVDSAAIAWERSDGTTVSWTLPDDAREGLAGAAAFEIDSYEVTVEDGSVTGFEVTVANVGDRDGTVRGLLRVPDRDPDPLVEREVAAGETTTVSEIGDYATPASIAEPYCDAEVPLELSPDRTIEPTVTCR